MDSAPEQGAPTSQPAERFFSKRNIHGAGWAILFAIVGYMFSYVDPSRNEPQEVIVKNIDSISDSKPIVVSLDGDAKSDLGRLREALAETLVALNSETRNQKDDVKVPATSSNVNPDTERELAETRAALREAIKIASESRRSDSNSATGPMNTAAAPISLLLPDQAAAPTLPVGTKGYTLMSPRGITGIRCPRYHNASKRLRFGFNADEKRLSDKSFRVSVARVDAPLKQTHLFEEYFIVRSGFNEVELDFAVDAGVYDVTLGYYDMRNVSGDFPPFYGVSCDVRVA